MLYSKWGGLSLLLVFLVLDVGTFFASPKWVILFLNSFPHRGDDIKSANVYKSFVLDYLPLFFVDKAMPLN